nr:AI-2E family transporter [uncultured Carboxylicivirga sp.]
MSSDLNRPYTFDRVVRMVLGVVLLGALIYVINLLKNVLGPFVVAMFIAYLLDPLVNFIQFKLRVKYRAAAVIIAVTTVLSVITVVLVFLIPAFVQEMNKMVILIRQYVQGVDTGQILPETVESTIKDLIHETELITLLSVENIAIAIKRVLPGFWNLFSGSLQVLVGLVGVLVILLYTIFILMDFQKLRDFLIDLVPGRYHTLVTGITNDLAGAMDLYFRSQGLIALIVGVLLAVGFKIIGLPMAIIIGLFIGALNIIPYLQILGIIPAMLLALLKAMETNQSFWHVALLVVIVLAVVQIIQETILTPKILGKAYGMNPALVLLSLSIWGSLMGLIGMLLALPLTAVIVSYYKRFALHRVPEKVAETE